MRYPTYDQPDGPWQPPETLYHKLAAWGCIVAILVLAAAACWLGLLASGAN